MSTLQITNAIKEIEIDGKIYKYSGITINDKGALEVYASQAPYRALKADFEASGDLFTENEKSEMRKKATAEVRQIRAGQGLAEIQQTPESLAYLLYLMLKKHNELDFSDFVNSLTVEAITLLVDEMLGENESDEKEDEKKTI